MQETLLKNITIPYFPKGLKYLTPLIFGTGVYLIIIRYPIWGIVLMLVSGIIITTKYVTEINLQEKKYFSPFGK